MLILQRYIQLFLPAISWWPGIMFCCWDGSRHKQSIW